MDARADLAITLTAEEWDRVVDVLSDGAFRKVSPLIHKIIEQAQVYDRGKQEDERPRLQPVS